MFKLKTDYPVAIDSPDHQRPLGTKNDNSKNRKFNEKLYKYLEEKGFEKPYYIMDFGCAGGGFIADCAQDGHYAIGLEGSDYSLKHKRAEWSHLSNKNLFTCDCTKDFFVFHDDCLLFQCFHAITAWEFMEHILEQDHEKLFDNISNNLRTGGVFIASVSTKHSAGPHHQCVHPKEWWLERVKEFGYEHDENIVKYFGQSWIRDKTRDNGFYLCLEKK